MLSVSKQTELEMTDKRALFDRAALGCISYLESFPECRTVTFSSNDAVQSAEFALWERRNSPHRLPQDLKAFYSVFNGFNLAWNVEIGEKIETIGEMRINKLDGIIKCNTEFIVQDKLPEDITPPSFKASTLFTFDSSSPLGEVVLLFRSGVSSSEDPEVWLLDQAGQLTHLCKTFTHYLRLLVVHLGIKGWQGVFMDHGWPPVTQLWMSMFCKERLVVDRHFREDGVTDRRS